MDRATKVFINGKIVTMDVLNTVAEAVALQGDKILAVGNNAEIETLVGINTVTINLEGKTMLPGFYDSHSHFSWVGDNMAFKVDLSCPPIGDKRTVQDCLDALIEFAKIVPDDLMVLGYGFDNTMIEEKRHLTRDDLDKVSATRMVAVTHISSHIGYVNSQVLAYLNYTEKTASPEGGIIHKDDSTGEPNGVLEENAYLNTGLDALAIPLDEIKRMRSMALASEEYLRNGVTTANDGFTESIENMKLMNKAIEAGVIKNRLLFNPVPAIMDEAYSLDFDHSNAKVGGVKLFQDGSIQGFTGFFREPYYTPNKGDNQYCGYPARSREELTEIMMSIYANHYQPVIHCNGDAALDDYLYALEKAQAFYPREDVRPIVIHCQLAQPDQLDKMKALGMTPSFFVTHMYYWGDGDMNLFFGPERGASMDPIRSAMDKGMICSIHCDTPVTPQKPLLAIWAAVNRQSFTGLKIGEYEKITVLDGIRAYTINAAYQHFEEQLKGSIEIGKLADFVILNQDILNCDPKNINDILVEETIVGGETVYKWTTDLMLKN